MSRWWRAYDEAVDDPKLIALTDQQHRAWFNILCVCSTFGGRLPDVSILSVKLRMQQRKVVRLINELRSAGLLDEDKGLIVPHNWSGRQYKSDVSTPRVKRFRNAKRNVSETPSETETEYRDRKKEEDAADAASTDDLSIPKCLLRPQYVFESGVIRLSEKNFTQWQEAFSHLDLKAELIGLTKWAGEQKDWFFALSGALAKRNREVKAARDRSGEFKQRLSRSGIAGVL